MLCNMSRRSLTLSKDEHNAFIYKFWILHISLSYKADYMNSRKMVLRQNIPALNIYSKFMK